MKALETDQKQIRKEFETVNSWDEWGAFVQKYFDWETAPERSVEQMEADLERSPVKCDGVMWEPFAGNYDVDPQIEYLFGELSEQAFARLSPEAHADNLKHPEFYGWKCVNCRLFTRKQTSNCPFCGQKLLRMPLNE